MVAVGKSLAKRGHNVTFLISDEYSDRAMDPEHATIVSYEMFHLSGLKKRMDDISNKTAEFTFAENSMKPMAEMRDMFTSVNREACESVFEDQRLLDRMAKFDAFVVDVVWSCGVYVKSFLDRHRGTEKLHVIVLAPMTPLPYIFQEAGSPFMTSYQPAPLTSFTSDMTFLQRFRNTVTYLFFVFWGNKMVINGFSTGLVDEYDLDPRLKSTISNHVDLFLINSDFSVEFTFAMMPNIIPVGGLTTRPAEALDNELENFMQSSGKHGVVLFSLGSYFASITKSRPDIIRMFIDAFSRLPHKVLLHLKEPPPYKIPDNIKAMKWLPLNDLLGHPKTRAVLYHGGNNGFLEALYHGVPLVVMPLGADQHDVAARVLANGLGTKIDKDRLSADYIYLQLNEVLENPSYSTNAKRLSAIFRDRPLTPANTAAFWIEHVMKHGGGHLHPPTHNLAFFQIYLLDIAAFGILLVVILFFIIKRAMRWCCCRKKIVKSKRD
ncbi:UDP-glucuronosyltransferase 2B7-like [Strongylocentrotus purpuratus]|uniref:Glucuronosyltransferase n=1 Tax=Strongylocentrotus purpuratus TaxID=7668 RepID=A0A7M7P998_STRPU|nr:UDP-glucuronosyltransferase 2B7-like [Strongylocentrotus purpuratus]